MFIGLGLILIHLLCMFKKCDSVYVGESNVRMKLKILQLDRELVLEAIRNVQRVEHFKNVYVLSVMYDIGDLIYKIRSKFARMTRLLMMSQDKLDVYKREQHIEHLTEIQKLAMDIYALVEIVEDWETSGRFQKQSIIPPFPNVPKSYRNSTRWHSVQPMYPRIRKEKEKPRFNYEGFDSDFN